MSAKYLSCWSAIEQNEGKESANMFCTVSTDYGSLTMNCVIYFEREKSKTKNKDFTSFNITFELERNTRAIYTHFLRIRLDRKHDQQFPLVSAI